MDIVHTAKINQTEYKRKADGKIDLDSYVGLNATITENGLTINTKIVGARTRYGHLDLNVTPQAGEGTRWVEYKNLSIVEQTESPVAVTANAIAGMLTPSEEIATW